MTRTFPEIYAAYRLSEEGGPKRLEIEARLLARQSPGEIAERVGLPAAVVETYEALFFQVSDRLAGRDWITLRAIGRWSGDVIPAVLLRGLAYHHGPLMVDVLAPYLAGNVDPFEYHPDPATLEGRVVQSLRLVLLAEMLPTGVENAKKLFQLHLDLGRCLSFVFDQVASGTSVSTALVAGTAALIDGGGTHPSYLQVIDDLFAGADSIKGLKGDITDGRRLDILGVLEAAGLVHGATPGQQAQPTVADLTALVQEFAASELLLAQAAGRPDQRLVAILQNSSHDSQKSEPVARDDRQRAELHAALVASGFGPTRMQTPDAAGSRRPVRHGCFHWPVARLADLIPDARRRPGLPTDISVARAEEWLCAINN